MSLMLRQELEQGLTLKAFHFPSTLFKYRSLNDYTLESIEYKSLWLASTNSLNDPFECLLLLDNDECLRLLFLDKNFTNIFEQKFGLEISQQELSHIIESQKPYETYFQICKNKGINLNITAEQQIETIQKRWREIVEETKDNVRICSFSEKKDSLLMWSHYAHHHQGICVEYDFSEDAANRAFLQPVYYDNKLFKLKTMEDLTGISHLIASIVKSKDWEYEDEWRLTISQSLNGKTEKVNSPTPKAIYLGPRYSLNNEYKRLQLKRICEENKIPMFQMKIHSTEYKVVIDYQSGGKPPERP